jgi:pilus assembly protein CpaF
VRTIRDQTASALNVLIHLARLPGGARKIVTICEITGMEGDVICLHDLFHFSQKGVDEKGNAYGEFEVCGVRPNLLTRLKAFGVEMPPDMFQHRVLPGLPSREGPKAAGSQPAEEPQKKKRPWL